MDDFGSKKRSQNDLDTTLSKTNVRLESVLSSSISLDSNQVTSAFIPDTSINQIELLDAASFQRHLPNEMNYSNEVVRHVALLNHNGYQVCSLSFLPGSSLDEVGAFDVWYRDKTNDTGVVVLVHEFVTESGIHLGITSNELKMIKGRPDSVDTKQGLTFYYFIDGLGTSSFLKRYNMPTYYARYAFTQDKLTRFSFGFVNP